MKCPLSKAHALKEKKALEEAYEEGFDVIFNHGYGCCAFAHNICGSQPLVPHEMLDTSKTLSPKFFINPRCPRVLSLPKPQPSMFARVNQ